MGSTTDFAATAALMSDPARAQILGVLMEGRALTASELARGAGIAPQTASGHLSKLTQGGLLAVSQQGRCRYYRIASPAVAHAIENLWALSSDLAASRKATRHVRVGPRDPRTRFLRTCFDHLAGALAVRMADSMIERGFLEMSFDGAVLAEDGVRFLDRLGVRIERAKIGSGAVTCRPCVDWSERRPHLAGAMGAALCHACFENGWLRRGTDGRAVSLTPVGRKALEDAFPLRAPFAIET
jgi:DNA-binding transcriptional ArsR family regulator